MLVAVNLLVTNKFTHTVTTHMNTLHMISTVYLTPDIYMNTVTSLEIYLLTFTISRCLVFLAEVVYKNIGFNM